MTIKAEPDLRIQLEAIKTKCEKLCANTCETGAAGGCFACEVWLDVQEEPAAAGGGHEEKLGGRVRRRHGHDG